LPRPDGWREQQADDGTRQTQSDGRGKQGEPVDARWYGLNPSARETTEIQKLRNQQQDHQEEHGHRGL